MRLRSVMKSLVVCTLLAGLGAPTASFAGPGSHGHHRGQGAFLGHGFIEEHAARLGLDEKTQEAIRNIVDESREKATELHARLLEGRREMRDLLSQETPDESAIMRQAEIIGENEIEARKHRLGTMLRIRALLTPDQRQELIKIRKESRPWKGRGKRGHGAEQ